MRAYTLVFPALWGLIGPVVSGRAVAWSERAMAQRPPSAESQVELTDRGRRIIVTTRDRDLQLSRGQDGRVVAIRDQKDGLFASFHHSKLAEVLRQRPEEPPQAFGSLLLVRAGEDTVEIRRRMTEPGKWSPGEVRRLQHDGYVYAVAFSPDGRRLLSSGFDLTLRLWDVESGKELRKFQGRKAYDLVNAVSWLPDGRSALLGHGQYRETQRLKLWNVEAWRETAEFEQPDGVVTCVAVSPDGRFAVSGTATGRIEYWEVATGRLLRRHDPAIGTIHSVAFAPSGRQVAYAGGSGTRDPRLAVWDVRSFEEVRVLRYGGSPWGVAFLPDGNRLLSGGSEGTIVLWDVDAGKLVRRFNAPDLIASLALLPDGDRFVSAGHDGIVCLWSVATGREVLKFEGHTDRLTSVAVSAQGRYAASAGYDRTVRLWALPLAPSGESGTRR